MDYFVYILHSEKLDKFYVGTTTDVEKRILEHNTAHYKDSFSVRRIPWTLFQSILCESSFNAYALERFIKKMKSSVSIRNLKKITSLLPISLIIFNYSLFT